MENNNINITWWDFGFILLVMGLMFVAGLMYGLKYHNSHVEDRINIILKNAYEDSECLKQTINQMMINKNISNISQWSLEEYNKLKNS